MKKSKVPRLNAVLMVRFTFPDVLKIPIKPLVVNVPMFLGGETSNVKVPTASLNVTTLGTENCPG